MNHTHGYPQRIVPRHSYKLLEIDNSFYDYFLVRYDTTGKPIPDLETFNKIQKENFSTGHFNKGWSTSLVGVFSKHDVRFVIKSKSKEFFSKPWDLGKEVKKSVKSKDFDYCVKRGYFGLIIRDVLSCTFYLDVNVDNKIERTDEVRYEITHEPTQCNYWHFSIYAYATNSLTGEKYYLRDELPSKNAAKNATRNIADILKRYVKLSDEVERIAISKKIYCEHAKKTRFYKAKRSK